MNLVVVPNVSVFIMTSVHPWDDPRIFYKEACSLAKKYRVELHAPANFKSSIKDKVKIIGLPKYRKRYLRPLNWIRLLYRAWKSKAQIVHFHDPELILVGLMLKFFTNKKVIYDVHEDVSATILTKPWIPHVLRPWLAKVVEKWEKFCSRYFDALVLVTSHIRKKFQQVPTLMEEIANYPLISFCRNGMERTIGDEVILVYAGGISISRGVLQMIQSLTLVKARGISFHFYLLGTWVSPKLKEEIIELIKDSNLQQNITITGRIPLEQVYEIYRQADIGLALLHAEKNYINSLATKIFEYMAVGIPVIASDFPLWQNLINQTQCGLTVNPLDVQEISENIIFLMRNTDLRRTMGDNGYQAFSRVYNWSTQEQKLWELYRSLRGDTTLKY